MPRPSPHYHVIHLAPSHIAPSHHAPSSPRHTFYIASVSPFIIHQSPTYPCTYSSAHHTPSHLATLPQAINKHPHHHTHPAGHHSNPPQFLPSPHTLLTPLPYSYVTTGPRNPFPLHYSIDLHHRDEGRAAV